MGLRDKEGSLNINDACFLLHFIQEHTAPLLSLRASDSAPAQPSKDCSSLQDLPRRKYRFAESHSNTDKKLFLQKDLEYCLPKSAQRDAVGSASGLDITSMEEFPPVSVQDKRCI